MRWLRSCVLFLILYHIHAETITFKDVPLTDYAGRVEACPGFSTSNADFSGCVCIAGYFTSSGSCVACMEGKYKDSVGNVTCTDCWDNSTSLAGSMDIMECLCDEGYTLVEDGAGYSCVECGVGKYKQFAGFIECRECSSHSITLTTGSTSKQDCHCDVGFTGPNGGPCEECGEDTFKNMTGSGVCFNCPEHSTTNLTVGLFTEIEACQCKAGYTGPNGGPCRMCEAGEFKAGVGPQACDDCPLNSNSSAGAVICLCNPGYDGVAGACLACEENEYKAESGEGPCVGCESNAYSAPASVECTCNPGWRGFHTSCVSCPPNRYCIGTGMSYPCPVNSSSPMYSVSEDDCTCLSGFEKQGDE